MYKRRAYSTKQNREEFMSKPSFVDFLDMLGVSWGEYMAMDDGQKKAAEIDYINRYGAPIKWWPDV